jgi:hypothetical protein
MQYGCICNPLVQLLSLLSKEYMLPKGNTAGISPGKVSELGEMEIRGASTLLCYKLSVAFESL